MHLHHCTFCSLHECAVNAVSLSSCPDTVQPHLHVAGSDTRSDACRNFKDGQWLIFDAVEGRMSIDLHSGEAEHILSPEDAVAITRVFLQVVQSCLCKFCIMSCPCQTLSNQAKCARSCLTDWALQSTCAHAARLFVDEDTSVLCCVPSGLPSADSLTTIRTQCCPHSCSAVMVQSMHIHAAHYAIKRCADCPFCSCKAGVAPIFCDVCRLQSC